MRYLFISYVAYNIVSNYSYGNISIECSDFPSMGKLQEIICKKLTKDYDKKEVIVLNIVELTSYDYHKLCA